MRNHHKLGTDTAYVFFFVKTGENSVLLRNRRFLKSRRSSTPVPNPQGTMESRDQPRASLVEARSDSLAHDEKERGQNQQKQQPQSMESV